MAEGQVSRRYPFAGRGVLSAWTASEGSEVLGMPCASLMSQSPRLTGPSEDPQLWGQQVTGTPCCKGHLSEPVLRLLCLCVGIPQIRLRRGGTDLRVLVDI